jgi:hypothetical protein
MSTTANTAGTLRVATASGAELAVRLVLYGEKFGPNSTYVNGGRVLVEFRRVGVSPAVAYVNSFQLDLFESIRLDVRFSPDGTLPLALPIAQVNRLVAWLEAAGVITHDGSGAGA